MAMYSGSVLGITPQTGVLNWCLEEVANKSCRIVEVSWGGEVTSSNAMRTRVARDSAIGSTRTTGNVQNLNSFTAAANSAFYAISYSPTAPTISAGTLFGVSWNAHGGVVRWLAAPGEEFVLVGSQSVECRQDVGAQTSSYSLVWSED